MVPHCLKIAIQTLYETENMANTGPLYRLFRNHPKYADLCLPFKLSNFASKKQCSI